MQAQSPSIRVHLFILIIEAKAIQFRQGPPRGTKKCTTLKFKFTSYDSGFVRGCIGGSIKAQRKVQTPAQEMNGVIEGELEAHKAMFTGIPLSL